ncbi:MAG: condensation domain-containing protein, partial [Acidobacteriota bacterium]|nr:condensation domain-containing protein [Acidobacteriota bacterium]
MLLSRLAALDDLLLGTPIANREQLATLGLIGLFLNTLVLRADLRDALGFADLLARSRRALLEDFAHQQIPFEALVEELAPGRDLGVSPLFQVLLVVVPEAREELPGLPGLGLRRLAADFGASKFDLTLSFVTGEQGLMVTAEYSRDLFEAPTVERLLAQLATFLAALVAAPTRPLGALPLLSAAERQQVTYEWNDPLPAPDATLPAA